MNERIELPDWLQLARYRIHLIPHKELRLPMQSEAVLRGGLGWALKQGACIRPSGALCTTCEAPDVCPYAYLFEGRTPADAEVLRAAQSIPQPYVFAAEAGLMSIAAGSPWAFHLTLIGDAIRYLPYLIAALRLLASNGLGEERVRCDLALVSWLSPTATEEVLYDQRGGRILRTQPSALSVADWAGEITAQDRLLLHFQTPTRLKYEADFVKEAPPFHVVIRTLLRRLSSLSYFYGGQRWETDYRGWIERAQAVTLAQAEVRWVDWERYSTRKQQRMNLGGIVGSVTYTGELTPFLPLLRLAELIHLGKGAVFGNGMVRVGG